MRNEIHTHMQWHWTCLECWVVMILDPCESRRQPSGESREATGEADGLITCISLRIPWATLLQEQIQQTQLRIPLDQTCAKLREDGVVKPRVGQFQAQS